MLTPRQVPYTGPYGLATSTHKSKGPTAEALKRAMSRLGYIPWRDFDQHYNLDLEAALDRFTPGKDGYGEGRWEAVRGARIPPGLAHAGEYALDFYARTLIQDEAGATSSGTDEEKVQALITEFWEAAVFNREIWHYDQGRPFRVDVDPTKGGRSDCSAMCVQAVFYAGRKSGIEVVDPAKLGFKGFGNTDWFEDDWPRVGAPYRVGDLAHFHSSRHVIQCVRPGNAFTAVWGSNGSERAPEMLQLATYPRFPHEFLFVVRPDLVPSTL